MSSGASPPGGAPRETPAGEVARSAPREVAVLLDQLEQVARQIGHSEALQDALVVRTTDLERRLARFQGRRPVPLRVLSHPSATHMSAPSAPAYRKVVDLLDAIEQLGRELGRADVLPVGANGAAPSLLAAAPTQPAVTDAGGSAERSQVDAPRKAATTATIPRRAVLRPIQPATEAAGHMGATGVSAAVAARGLSWPWRARFGTRAFVVRVAIGLALVAGTVLALVLVRDDDQQPANALATATEAATPLPTPPATLAPVSGSDTRVPGIYTLGGTPTSTPTIVVAATSSATSAQSATPTSGEPGIGSPRFILEGGLGPARETLEDGTVVYVTEQASVTVLYSDDGLALRLVLDVTSAEPPITRAAAADLLAAYRPRDATLIRAMTPSASVARQIYASAALESRFAGGDTGGRNPSRYVEDVRSDPSSDVVESITIALGARP